MLLLPKFSVAEIAFVHGAVVRVAYFPLFIIPTDELVCDDALSISCIELLVDEFPVDVACI